MSVMRQIIDEAITLSEQVLQLAEMAHWDAFAEIDVRRQKLIRSLIAVDIDARDANLTREKLQHLIEMNDQLELICSKQRARLVDVLQELRQGGKAVKAYQH